MDAVWLVIFAAIAAYAAYKYLASGGDVISEKKRELGEYTRKDVAQHNSRDSLWLILKRETGFFVYDLTSYIDEHPGGDAILSNAGGDSTDSFFGPQHPPRVLDLIDDYCIGRLAE